MDKFELERFILQSVKDADSEWISARQVYKIVSAHYDSPPSYNRVRHRLDSFVTHNQMETMVAEQKGYKAKCYRVREGVML